MGIALILKLSLWNLNQKRTARPEGEQRKGEQQAVAGAPNG